VNRQSLFLLLLAAWPASPLAAADWPQLLGPARNLVSQENVQPWPAGGPRLLWKRKTGAGFAAPVLVQGKMLLFTRTKDREVVEAIDARTGKLVWTGSKPTLYRDDFGFDEGPRSAPTVAGGRVFTYGAEGTLSAWDFATGKPLWSVDTMTKYNVPKNFFGAANAPLVAGERVLVNVGGPGSGIVAFDAATGKQLWKSTNDAASYSSGTLATIGGRQLAVFLTREGLAAVDPGTGAVVQQKRWRSRSQASVNAATPLVDGDEVFLSASYGTGAVLFKAQGDSWPAVWSGDDSLSNHYSTSVLHEGRLFGFHGRQEMGQSLRCVEWKTGKVIWSLDRFGAGTLLRAGANLLVLREDGELMMAPASPAGFQPVAKARLFDDSIVRAYPAVSDGVFCARSEGMVGCWDLSAK
jgi:outer membrane protein assembly factor BamB